MGRDHDPALRVLSVYFVDTLSGVLVAIQAGTTYIGVVGKVRRSPPYD